MRKVELIYIEVMNETEQLFVFGTVFNGKLYSQLIIMNMALPVNIQDSEFQKIVHSLSTITRKDVKNAVSINRG